MMRAFIFRTIHKGKIKWNHKFWKTTGNVDHIEGRRLVFATYPNAPNLLSLWGTIDFYKHPNPDDKIGGQLWKEICEIMGQRTNEDALKVKGGHYLMDQSNRKEWIAYKGRGIDWWHPVLEGK